jgi:hypothetical protein
MTIQIEPLPREAAVRAHFFEDCVIPKARVFANGPRNPARTTERPTRDPSLRLENGYAQDDAIEEHAVTFSVLFLIGTPFQRSLL